MSALTIIIMLAAAVAVFYLVRASAHRKDLPERKPELHRHRATDRREENDRRKEVRFEPDQNPRRTGHGKRKEETMWSDESK